MSRMPIEIPMLDMRQVRTTAILQKGMAHMPAAVTSRESPEETHKNPGHLESKDTWRTRVTWRTRTPGEPGSPGEQGHLENKDTCSPGEPWSPGEPGSPGEQGPRFTWRTLRRRFYRT